MNVSMTVYTNNGMTINFQVTKDYFEQLQPMIEKSQWPDITVRRENRVVNIASMHIVSIEFNVPPEEMAHEIAD